MHPLPAKEGRLLSARCGNGKMLSFTNREREREKERESSFPEWRLIVEFGAITILDSNEWEVT
jgi:hypothetical protein